MVSNRSLQHVNGPRPVLVVVNRAEGSSRLDGNHSHAQLAPFHTLYFEAEINRGQKLNYDTVRLRRHPLFAHCAVLSVRPVHCRWPGLSGTSLSEAGAPCGRE